MSRDYHAEKNKEKKIEKAERAIDGDDNDELVLCLLIWEDKKKKKRKFVLWKMLKCLWGLVCCAT